MDDVTIHIDEINLNGSIPLDQDALALAIGGLASKALDPTVVFEVSRAVALSLSIPSTPPQDR